MRIDVAEGHFSVDDLETVALMARALTSGYGETYPKGQPRPPWRAAALLVTITDEPGVFGSSIGGYLFHEDGPQIGLPDDREALEDLQTLAEQLYEARTEAWSTLVLLVDRAMTVVIVALLDGAAAKEVAYEPETIDTLGDRLLVRFGDPSLLT